MSHHDLEVCKVSLELDNFDSNENFRLSNWMGLSLYEDKWDKSKKMIHESLECLSSVS